MESSLFQPVAPVAPVAPYIGGKRNLVRRLLPLIEAKPHTLYAEPFVGMGGVFLRRRTRPKAEIINDWSRDLSTFYRVLQVHYAHFLELLRFQITSRAEFERLCAVDPDTLTDMQRAARFLYLQSTAFGGKVAGRNFGVSYDRGGRFDLTRISAMLEDLHERLAGVTIERMTWQRFMARYDRPGTLFYLDPPYFGCEDDYGEGQFGRDEFEVMAEVLANLRGDFILSINDRPEVRKVFKAFNFNEVSVPYTVGKGTVEARELIITR